MCLAPGRNTVTLMRLEPLARQSQVKHSTTEPLWEGTDGSNDCIHYIIIGKRQKKIISFSCFGCPKRVPTICVLVVI